MVANFSQGDIVLPKATVVGVKEEISSCVVAAIKDGDVPGNPPHDKRKKDRRRNVYTVGWKVKFKRYLDSNLGHIRKRERAAMEPVLTKYMHVFHDDEDNQFKGTDLVEHRIITGEAKRIPKALYRVPFAIRGQMENQLRVMLQKGVFVSSSPSWAAPATLVPKKSPDVARHIDFAWAFASSMQSCNSIPTPCRSSRKLLPPFTAVGSSPS